MVAISELIKEAFMNRFSAKLVSYREESDVAVYETNHLRFNLNKSDNTMQVFAKIKDTTFLKTLCTYHMSNAVVTEEVVPTIIGKILTTFDLPVWD